MKKSIITLMALMVSGAAFAGDYATVDYQNKDLKASTETHDVFGFAVGHNYTDKFSVEGRMEDEIVHDPSKHEGLVQLKGVYNVGTWYHVTPYVGSAVGYKSKATINFDYYVLEGGVKVSPIKDVSLKVQSRLRTPFGESTMHGSTDSYRTIENSATLAYAFIPKNAVSVKYADEHGDKNYRTWGVGYTHSF